MKIDTLHTARLTVRPFALSDRDALAGLFGGEPASDDARAARERWLTWASLSPEQLWSLRQVPYGDRAVVLNEGAALIGSVGLVPILLPPIHPGDTPDTVIAAAGPMRPAMGLYWAINAEHRGRGYAVEAAGALIEAARVALDLAEVYAVTTFDNAASQRVMAKLSMTVARNTSGEPAWLQVLGHLSWSDGVSAVV